MEHQESSVEKFEKFTWKIEYISHLWDGGFYSEPFVLGGYPWKIFFCKGKKLEDDWIVFTLIVVPTSNMSNGWSRDVKLKFFVVNQVDTNMTITEESTYEFNSSYCTYSLGHVLMSTEIHDPNKGFIVNDACIVGVEVHVQKSTNERRVNQSTNITASPRPNLEQGNCHNVVELKDFKGLGEIEKKIIPLLEEACSEHPLLIVCQQKRSRQFREWAFTALGRVLYFLKTRKVKDMIDLACKDLQILWEELQPFGFDLAWLEPCVQSALEMKNYLEKVKKVDKLKDNVVSLELELERLESKKAIVEVNLDIARDLLKAEHLEKIDLDAELGFVKL